MNTILILTLAFVRTPYLQNLTDSTVVVCWQSATAECGRVEYGSTSKYGLSVCDSIPTIDHALTLVGLERDEEYYYWVVSGADTSKNAWFHAPVSPGRPFWFFVVGDNHSSDTLRHKSVVEEMVRHIPRPTVLLNAGDLTNHGTEQEYRRYFEIEHELLSRVPVLPALGNHDRGNTSNWRRFFALPNNERWYSFRCGSSAFHAVSSYDGRTPGSVQYNWLLNELLADSAAGMRHIFVWMHNIVWSTSQGAPDNVAKTYLCPLFERFGVEIVFCGHVHAYEHSLVNGVHYITTGGGGDSAVLPPDGWDAWQPWTVYREGTWECVRVDVEDDMVRSVGIRPDGSQFDTLCLYGGGISEPRQPLSAPGLRSAGAVQVYDATGRLVRGAPPPGVYFRRTGLRTTRELIRSKDWW